jgi:hypothetical protein
LRDGAYLSASLTKTLRAQLVTYNPDAQVFGYWRLSFSWEDSGDISAVVNLLGLPAISYGDAITSLRVSRFLPDFFLILLILGYVVLTAHDVYRQFAEQGRRKRLMRHFKARKRWDVGASVAAGGRAKIAPGEFPDGNPFAGDDSESDHEDAHGMKASVPSLLAVASSACVLHAMRSLLPLPSAVFGGRRPKYVAADGKTPRMYKPRMTVVWLLYEVVVCCLMIAALVVFYTYAVRLSVRDYFTSRFDIYDADTFARARYFLMLRRASPASMVSASNITGFALDDLAVAGMPGRWALPSDAKPLNEAGAMYARLDDMYQYIVSWRRATLPLDPLLPSQRCLH